jgi:transposase
VAQRAGELLGIGPVTSSALAATVPDAKAFRSGCPFGAWLGLAPRQHSSGGKTRLGRISRRGNVYLRKLLIQGARSTLQAAINAELARQPITALDHRALRPQGLLQDVDRHRQHTCPHPLGHARQG